MEELIERFKKLPQKQKIIITVVLSIIILIAFGLIYKAFYVEDVETLESENIEENVEEMQNKIEEERESKIGILENKKTVTVHVVGEVNSPGVYTLNEGSRIIDAINSAGGRTEEADLSKINLAYIIEDGIQIYIPSIRENKSSNEELRENSYIREDAGDDIISSTVTKENEGEGTGKEAKVNINTANLEKLQTLPGIGQSTAQKIIEYRQQNGKFKTEEDLKNVTGIGESKYENLKDKVTVK